MAQMPYRDVRTFWVEPTGKHRVTVRLKDGTSLDLGVADSDEEAQRRSDAKWLEGDIESSGWEPMYRLPDGREVSQTDLPVGAVWDCPAYHDVPQWCGPDGLALWCKLPNGHEWHIDGRASNCTKPDDRVHKCWCRAGDPRTGTLHVTKEGLTCAAGAGSILSGDYHGFLVHGVLQDCDRSAELATQGPVARAIMSQVVQAIQRHDAEQVPQPPRGGIMPPRYGNAGS